MVNPRDVFGLPAQHAALNTLIARVCNDPKEPDGDICNGTLVFKPGQLVSVCDLCGASAGRFAPQPVDVPVEELFSPEPPARSMRDVCGVDGRPIKVMSFRGTGVCSEICRKFDNGEITEEKYVKLKSDFEKLRSDRAGLSG